MVYWTASLPVSHTGNLNTSWFLVSYIKNTICSSMRAIEKSPNVLLEGVTIATPSKMALTVKDKKIFVPLLRRLSMNCNIHTISFNWHNVLPQVPCRALLQSFGDVCTSFVRRIPIFLLTVLKDYKSQKTKGYKERATKKPVCVWAESHSPPGAQPSADEAHTYQSAPLSASLSHQIKLDMETDNHCGPPF